MRYHEIMSEAALTSPQFIQWFGQSKVVDRDGNPLQVYHGTKQDFQEFSLNFLGANTTANSTAVGFFFTDSAKVAAGFANGEGGRTLPVYLSMQKPLVIEPSSMDYQMRRTSYEMTYRRDAPMRRHYHPHKDPYHQLYDWVMLLKRTKGIEGEEITTEDCAMLRTHLVEKGFDGVIIKETYIDSPMGVMGGLHNFYIVFRPNQIKSSLASTYGASDNIGESTKYSR